MLSQPMASLMEAEAKTLPASPSCRPYCDLEKAVQTGRATWICPVCKADVSMMYLFWLTVFYEGENEQAPTKRRR